MLKTLSMSNSDIKFSVDAAGQSDKGHLEYEEVTFKDITDDAVLSISICPEQLCGKILKNNTTLQRHMKGKHGQIKATKSETFNLDGTSTCKYCGKHFTRKSNMKLHMKKCSASRAQAKVDDDNSGGREENPSGENNLGTWSEIEEGSRKIENDLFNSIFEPEVQQDNPTHGIHGGDIVERADRDDDRDKDGGVGDEDDGDDKEGNEAGGEEEEENIDLVNVNNHAGIEVGKDVKEEERKEAVKELSSHEASLLSLLASGLATSSNILSSLFPQLQVFTNFSRVFGCCLFYDPNYEQTIFSPPLYYIGFS